MNIDIITTKKKLSKAIIKQLEPATTCDIQLFVLHKDNEAFYVRDLGAKYHHRVGLFKSNSGEWRTIQLKDWVVSQATASKITTKNQYRHFGSADECERWLLAYNELKERALKNHLII